MVAVGSTTLVVVVVGGRVLRQHVVGTVDCETVLRRRSRSRRRRRASGRTE
jgi:hypothetical protein